MALFGRSSEKDERRAIAMTDWVRRRNPFALASVVLGAFSFSHVGALLVDSLAAVVIGVIALVQFARNRSPQPCGRGLAWLGIALGVGSLAIAAVLYTRG